MSFPRALSTRFLIAASLLMAWLGTSPVPAAPPLPQVPSGFEISLAAAAPVVERPVMACFDEHGRLFVVDSAGVNHRFVDLVKDPPHRIVIVEDTNADGVFDKRTLFADKLVMPQGVLPYRGAVYVASPPSVWKLEDTNGDGTCDKRTEIVSEFGSNGNAADIHGPFLGPDGWLYLCDGRHGHTVKQNGVVISQGKSGGIFRFRTDGSGFERICGGGFDNPVEIDFTPEGEILGTVNILQGNPRQDCLMHWIEGGVYPRAEQPCIAEFLKTGDLLPPITQFGHVAVSGMMRYRSRSFGPDYQHNVFVTQFNRHKVTRSILTRQGATFASQDEDFLVSTDNDFHPTDVLEDADGSLLVINTGGWFRIGCPVSQIAKPDVLGNIYRIRKTAPPVDKTTPGKNAPAKTPVDTSAANKAPANKAAVAGGWEGLVEQLDDPRPVVQQRALEALVTLWQRELSAEVQESLQKMLTRKVKTTDDRRRHLIWTLSRIDTPQATDLLLLGLQDPNESIRLSTIRALGLTRGNTGNTEPRVAAALLDPRLLLRGSLAVRREIATALGRVAGKYDMHRQMRPGAKPESTALTRTISAALLESLRVNLDNDLFQQHAVIQTLLQVVEPEIVAHHLEGNSPLQQRAALIVLDQLDVASLAPAQVVPLLTTSYLPLRETAVQVIARRKGWGASITGNLRDWLTSPADKLNQDDSLRGVLVAQAQDPSVQQLVAELLASPRTSSAARLILWDSLLQVNFDPFPESWLEAIERGLSQGSADERGLVVSLLQKRSWDRFDPALQQLAAAGSTPAALRVDAYLALSPRWKAVPAAAFEFLRRQLRPDTPPLQRLSAARALGAASLSREQLVALLEILPEAGPLAVPVLLRAFQKSGDEALGLQLMGVLSTSSSAGNLSSDDITQLVKTYPPPVQQAARELLNKRGGDSLAQQRGRLQELSPLLTGGNAAKGKEIFFGKRAACGNCHAVGALGSRIGPDLTKIAGSRSPADLLEAIVFPSATFAREYRPYTAVLTSGKTVSGLITRQSTDALFLRLADLSEVRLSRTEIEELTESNTSIMPQGLDTQLTPAELRDLLAYVQQLK